MALIKKQLNENDKCDGKCCYCIARTCCVNAYRKKNKFVKRK